MPVYNGEKYIAESVQTVLNQTYADFELIVVNDCSTDKTLDVLNQFKDKRLIVLTNEKNIGSAASRTKAINSSTSKYVAILDADDIAYPSRFKKQMAFLDAREDFGMVATWVKIIDEEGKATGVVLKDKTASEKIPATLLFHNIFACSSVMLRRSALPKNPFRQETMPVEDVDLWLRMISADWKFGIIKEVLTEYRSHESGISKVYSEKRKEIMDGLLKSELKKLEIYPNEQELMIHRSNFGYAGNDLENFLEERGRWLTKLKNQNDKLKLYQPKIFNEVVAEKFFDSLRSNCRRLGIQTWKIFWKSDLSNNLNWRDNWQNILKFALKCLLCRPRTDEKSLS